MGFKKGWKAYKASLRKRSKGKTTRTSKKSKGGNPRKMAKRTRTIPLGRTIGTAASAALIAIDALQPNPVIESAMAGDFVGAAVNFAANVRANFHPARLFANASPAIITNVAGGILDKARMNKSVEVMGYRFKGL